MKIFPWILGAFISVHSLTFSSLETCPDKIELDGVLYVAAFNLSNRYLFDRFGDSPVGLSFKSVIKDSLFLIVEAEICFEGSEEYQIPEDMKRIKVPLKVIFPEANSDTVWASSIMGEAVLMSPGRGLISLLIRNGRFFRFYQNGDFDEEYSEFNRIDVERANTEKFNSKDPRFVELMERLKPYYGEKLWKLARRNHS